MEVFYITWEQHADAAKVRFRAPHASLAEAKVQAQHDVDVNNRVAVRVEDAEGRVVWKPKA